MSALPDGTLLGGDYRVVRVLGAGGFGVTYLADEPALSRRVSIKEYFPADFAARTNGATAVPRSKDCTPDYTWGLERFIEEAQTLAKFDHRNIVKVYRIFQAHNTAYMVLQFEEGQSLKTWLKELGRAPRQKELDAIIAPLLDALSTIHRADVLHRDIAPDNIIIRANGEPVLIDFGAARGDIAAHLKTKTVSALVKPGYSPYEQYAETSRQQGPWTDIYALAATLYHAVTGKRPPDSPSRMLKDEMVPARDAALAGYRASFLDAIQKGLALAIDDRPRSIAEWRGALLAPEPQKPGVLARMKEKTEAKRTTGKRAKAAEPPVASAVPPPPDAPGPKGGLLDFVDALQKPDVAQPLAAKAADTRKAPRATPPPLANAAASVAAPAAAPAASPFLARLFSPARANPKPASRPDLPAAAPLPPPRPATRKPLKPAPDVPRRPLISRGLKVKIGLAAGIAAGLMMFQDQIPRVLATPPAARVTTGSVGPAPSATPALLETAQFKAHAAAIDGLGVSGDGRLIATTASDGMLKVWSAETRAPLLSIALEDGPAASLAVRNNRALTAHSNGAVALYDLESGRRVFRFQRNDAAIWAASFAGSEDRVATAGHDWVVSLWETGDEKNPVALLQGHESAVQAVAVDEAARWVASGGADRAVRLWNMDTKRLRRVYRNHSDYVSALAFSPDGDTLAAGALDGTVKLWATQSNRVLRVLTGHTSRITSLAFAPDGSSVASAAEDGTVRLRGVRHARLSWSITGLEKGARSVAFLSDGRILLTGGQDGTVRYWALPQAQLARRD